jgi:hypothetical protein
MDEIFKRLGAVENQVSDIRAQVGGLGAQIPQLATKADVAGLETSLIKWLIGTVSGVAALAFSIAKFIH